MKRGGKKKRGFGGKDWRSEKKKKGVWSKKKKGGSFLKALDKHLGAGESVLVARSLA